MKVSAVIPEAQHVRLARIALRNKTTIGAIVSYAIGRTLAELREHPERALEAAPDRRRVNGGKS